MMCPRCGNEWDVSKSPCSNCGLLVRLPGHARIQNTAQKQQPAVASSGNEPPTFPFSSSSGGVFENSAASGGETRFNNMSDVKRPAGVSDTDRPLPRSIAARPLPSAGGPGAEQPSFDRVRQPSPLRARRFVTDSLRPEGSRDATTSRRPNNSPLNGGEGTTNLATNSSPLGNGASGVKANAARSASAPLSNATGGPTVERRSTTDSLSESSPSNRLAREIGSMAPGITLRSGRYRLRELLGRHEWTAGVYEAMWIAKDAQRSGAEVMVCEFVTPEPESMTMQSVLRAASMALTFVSRHPRIPTMLDTFKEHGRGFFVFELIHGESLFARVRRTGRTLSEQEVIECCLQLTDILELLAQHQPPLIHSLMRPEHVVMSHLGPHYILTNFSVALAGGATQVLAGLERTRLSPYMAPELVRGVVDVRADLYSLLATAYYAVTGNAPVGTGGVDTIPPARRLNSAVSPQFDVLLAKGLRHNPSQRYQHPTELRQALLAIRSTGNSAQESASPLVERPSLQPQEPSSASSVDQALPNLLAASIESEPEHKLALPNPDELPPMPERDDKLHSILWVAGMLVCLIVLVYFSRGLL